MLRIFLNRVAVDSYGEIKLVSTVPRERQIRVKFVRSWIGVSAFADIVFLWGLATPAQISYRFIDLRGSHKLVSVVLCRCSVDLENLVAHSRLFCPCHSTQSSAVPAE